MSESDTFDRMRLLAMISPPKDPLRQEVEDASWADYGRAVHLALMSDRFITAVLTGLQAYNADKHGHHPQRYVARVVRTFLTTGTIAS